MPRFFSSGVQAMNPRHGPATPSEVVKMLLADGWLHRKGKGDHRNFTKAGFKTVTVDMGVREIPTGTLRAIYRTAGWAWQETVR